MRLTPWADEVAAHLAGPAAPDALQDGVRASRLLGGDPFLVLHGGGNSSATDGGVLHVKASGHDMGTIGPEGFAPLAVDAVLALLERPSMTDSEMVAALRAALLDPEAPNPSIETPLHGLLPFTSVLHTHADAIVTLTNTRDGAAIVADLFGDAAPLLPYCMPGFELAQLVRARWPELRDRGAVGFVLAHHGVFTYGEDARTAYERHVGLVRRAERFIAERTGVLFEEDPEERRSTADDDPALAALAADVHAVVGGDVVVEARRSPQIDAFLAREDLAAVTGRGPTTLEHVIHTKRTPLIGRDVTGFVREYQAYVERNRHRSAAEVTMLDPMPRVVLDPELGLVALGRTPARAGVAADIYRHTMRIITAAEALGGYVTISEGDAFDIEYWELEQAKLR